MADKKISEVTPKAAQLQDDDLLIISDYNGATYDTKSVTGANIRPFTTIMFNLSQTGTSAPTTNWTYETEVSQTFTLARTSVGQYTLTASSALFTLNKTFAFITPGGSSAGISYGVIRNSTTQLTFYSSNSGGYVDAVLDLAFLKINIIK